MLTCLYCARQTDASHHYCNFCGKPVRPTHGAPQRTSDSDENSLNRPASRPIAYTQTQRLEQAMSAMDSMRMPAVPPSQTSVKTTASPAITPAGTMSQSSSDLAVWTPASLAQTAPHSAKPDRCTICESEFSKGKVAVLYDHPVCVKCRDGLANRRIIAEIIDRILFQLTINFSSQMTVPLASFVLSILFTPPSSRELLGLSILIGSLLSLGIGLTWMLLKDGFNGSSPGKWMMGLQVLDERTGQPAGFGASVKRQLPFLIWFVQVASVFRMRTTGWRIGDGWAHTRVIWKKHAHCAPFRIGEQAASSLENQPLVLSARLGR